MKLLFIASIVACAAGLAFSCFCGTLGAKPRIVNGANSAHGSHPWMASFFRMDSLNNLKPDANLWPYCGGTLINDRYIVTAAHCFAGGKRPDEIAVVLDFYNIDDLQSREFLKVDNYTLHPNYDGEPKNPKGDIALVRLSKPVTMSSRVAPLCLPSKRKLEFDRLTAVGWGRTRRGGDRPQDLQEADLIQDSTWTCTYGEVETFLEDHICVKDETSKDKKWKDICSGDSGGPLIATEDGVSVLSGLTSWGTCLGVMRSVFTRVSFYLDWIIDNTKDAVYCEKPTFI